MRSRRGSSLAGGGLSRAARECDPRSPSCASPTSIGGETLRISVRARAFFCCAGRGDTLNPPGAACASGSKPRSGSGKR
jgi:hypothetical protein